MGMKDLHKHPLSDGEFRKIWHNENILNFHIYFQLV
jgi:hypothetical protein